jgi:protein involved in polysaccharide export with SLBB domain
MRGSRLLLPILAALAVAGCMRHEPSYVAAGSQSYAGERGLFTHRAVADAQPPIIMQYQPPREAIAKEAPPHKVAAREVVAKDVRPHRAAQREVVVQESAPYYVAPRVLPPAIPQAYAYAPAVSAPPYTLDSGDKLRVVVFGQEGLSNSYLVDAGGHISMPLIGSVPARAHTTQQLAYAITQRLKQGYIRDPHVSVEIEAYRPFFILGEVTTPGQYPYVANMTVEKAVAIAGGFSPRAYKYKVELTHTVAGEQIRSDVPLDYLVRPGDTVMVKERWF